jgi:hypothetical protein|tara:strand:+ start:409 stop:705 length:297 start_codon:yes stop_codon:yes gene_type:complete
MSKEFPATIEEVEGAVPIPGYPGYSITPSGEVWRTTPPKRGPFAGCPLRRVVPSIHPRGHQWYVFVTNTEGVRQRKPIRLLLEVAKLNLPVDGAGNKG